jgi:hypothetical protein
MLTISPKGLASHLEIELGAEERACGVQCSLEGQTQRTLRVGIDVAWQL